MRTNKDKQLLRHISEYCSRVEEAVKSGEAPLFYFAFALLI